MPKQQFVDPSGNLVDVSEANPLPSTIVATPAASTVDRELVVITYFAKINFTGATAGDTITLTQIIDVTATPTTVSSIWRNQSTATNLASAPTIGTQIELVGQSALTDGQLRATAVPVSASSLPLPTGAATEASSQSLIKEQRAKVLVLEFNNIANAPVTSGVLVDWNTYFATSLFYDITISGNVVYLKTRHSLELKDSIFVNSTSLIRFLDYDGIFVKAKDSCFDGCTSLYICAMLGVNAIGNGFLYASSANANLTHLIIPNCNSIGDQAVNKRTGLSVLVVDRLLTIGNSGFLGSFATTALVAFPSLELTGTSFCVQSRASGYVFPKLKYAGRSFLQAIVSTAVVFAPEVSYADSYAFSGFPAGSTVHVPSLMKFNSDALNPFSITNLTYIVSDYLSKDPILKEYKTAVPSLSILQPNVAHSKTYTTDDLTSIATTGTALPCEGATLVDLSITLGTATTAPTIQVQGTHNGTNWFNLGVPLLGIASSTVTTAISNVLPVQVRWKVSVAGATIGAGWSINLRAK